MVFCQLHLPSNELFSIFCYLLFHYYVSIGLYRERPPICPELQSALSCECHLWNKFGRHMRRSQSKQKNKFQMTERFGKWLDALQQQPASKDFSISRSIQRENRSLAQMHFDQQRAALSALILWGRWHR